VERYRKSSLGELIQGPAGGQAAIDSLPDPVVMLDATGGLQGCNQAAATLLRLDPKGTGALSFDEVDSGCPLARRSPACPRPGRPWRLQSQRIRGLPAG